MRLTRFLLLVILLAGFIAAKSTLMVPAVDINGKGMITRISADVEKGTGGVYVDIEPFINIDTQNSAKVAAQVAAREAGVELDNKNVLFKVQAETETVDGPSGGFALALLAYSELTFKTLRPDLSVTGTIERDGSIGPVGGVFEKAQAAHDNGVTLFLVPFGQGLQGDINLNEYFTPQGMQVVEMQNLKTGLDYAFTAKGQTVEVPKYESKKLVVDKITPSQATEPLKEMSIQVIQDVEDKTRSIDDELAKATILQQMNESRYLLEQGYYYSAANNAFLRQIDLDAIDAQNLSKNEFAFRVQSLLTEASAFQLPQPTTENLEWVVGAQLRASWAKSTLEKLSEALDSSEPAALAVDYAAAKNWFEAAQQMASAAKKVTGGQLLEEVAAKDYAEELLGKARDAAQFAIDGEVQNKADLAGAEFQDGHYFASSFDSLMALSYARAEQDLKNLYGDEVNAVLKDASHLSELDSLWSQLYYAHSLYNQAQADSKSNFVYTVNAIKLQVFADNLEENVAHIKLAFMQGAAVSGSKISTNNQPFTTTVQIQPSDQFNWARTLFWIIVFLFGAVMLYALFDKHVRTKNAASPLSNEDRLQKLEDALLTGRITESTYERLHKKYGGAKPVVAKRKPKKRG
ncbi:MAG: S16 family serine protease [Candidatus Micrarchaeota archaeon]